MEVEMKAKAYGKAKNPLLEQNQGKKKAPTGFVPFKKKKK